MKKNRKKLRYITALFAVVLCMAALPLTAYAGGGDESIEEPPTETVEAVPAEPNPFTPSGTGTVVDNATDADGKEFYTIMTPDEHVFYLVIDRQRNTDNVYFLNAVTVNDLLALAEPSPDTGSVSAIPDDTGAADPPPASASEPEPTEEPEAEPEQGGGAGMIILIVVIVLGAGGAAYYFKIYRPKQQNADSSDEYEGPDAGAWDDDTAPWPDDDEAPPWDVDEEEAREDYEAHSGEGEDE